MLDTIYIARHGFRQAFHSFVKASPTGTMKDPPLTALGHDQARELASYLASLPQDNTADIEEGAPQMIFSSPYYRCLQTATYSAEALQLPIHVEFGISEYYQRTIPGTGLHPRPPSPSKLSHHFPLITAENGNHINLLYASREGETMSEIHSRANDFIELFIAYMNDRFPDVKRVLLVSHAATVIALGRALTHDEGMEVRAGTCSLSVYRRSGQNGQTGKQGNEAGRDVKWTCVKNGWTGHLAQGEQRHWDFTEHVEMEEEGEGEGVLQEHERESQQDESKSKL